ncbi:Hypothetical predicted protein [Olea europaea subsp. europaea]|nr:Hypothetical predicted protein [Olea europaea subsp. europaea]
MESSQANNVPGLDYWLKWKVLVCALIFLLPAAVAVILLRKRTSAGSNPLNSNDLWVPCWRNLNPKWLLFYRAIAFVSMSFLLYEVVAAFGFFVFFFYTQVQCSLLLNVHKLATSSFYGESKKYSKQVHQSFRTMLALTWFDNNLVRKANSRTIFSLYWHLELPLPIIVYETCGGAVMLTDIVFWGLLLPFMTGENFQLTLLIGCMHSVNALLLILDSAVNSMPFPWFGLVYFVLWSVAYVVFQWVLHACCFTWWPYPFLELSTPWAPLW